MNWLAQNNVKEKIVIFQSSQKFLFLLSLMAYGGAHAVDCSSWSQKGAYANVSGAGYASKDQPLIICTAINAWEAKTSGTLVMTEAKVAKAIMEVKYTNTSTSMSPYPIRVVDSWKRSMSEDDQALIGRVRYPARDTDAAIMLSSEPRTWLVTPHVNAYDDPYVGMCVYGYPESGRDWVSVSVTNMGESSVDGTLCYPVPKTVFQR